MESLTPDKKTFEGVTHIVSLDCEMVLARGFQPKLARISITNYNGHVLLDKIIKQKAKVDDFLTDITGLNRYNIKEGVSYSSIKQKVEELLKNKIVVGHTLTNDLLALEVELDIKNLRDIAEFKLFKKGKKRIALKELASKYLGLIIQTGVHSSVEDARAAMELYKLYEKEMNMEFKDRYFG